MGKSRCASLMNGLMTASSSDANERSVSQLTRGIRSRVRARYAQNPIKSTSLSSWTLQTIRTQVSTSRGDREGEGGCCAQTDSLAEGDERMPDDGSTADAEQGLGQVERQGAETRSCYTVCRGQLVRVNVRDEDEDEDERGRNSEYAPLEGPPIRMTALAEGVAMTRLVSRERV